MQPRSPELYLAVAISTVMGLMSVGIIAFLVLDLL